LDPLDHVKKARLCGKASLSQSGHYAQNQFQ
jgi:hypothetical protein